MTKPLNPTLLQRRDHYCFEYAVVLPGDISLEDTLEPSFWSHINAHTPPKLRQHDTIRVIPEDGSYFAELIVLQAGKGFAQVKLLRHLELDVSPEVSELRLVDVVWRGPAVKFAIERKKDGVRLKQGFTSRADAEMEARGYELVAA
jgi:hypothetical protein